MPLYDPYYDTKSTCTKYNKFVKSDKTSIFVNKQIQYNT